MTDLDDRVPYTCTRCGHVTYAPSGKVAVTCGHCGIIDIGTELARRQWATVAEIRMELPPTPKPALQAVPAHSPAWPWIAVGITLALYVVAAVVAEVVLR